jgi:hypothetical protein
LKKDNQKTLATKNTCNKKLLQIAFPANMHRQSRAEPVSINVFCRFFAKKDGLSFSSPAGPA